VPPTLRSAFKLSVMRSKERLHEAVTRRAKSEPNEDDWLYPKAKPPKRSFDHAILAVYWSRKRHLMGPAPSVAVLSPKSR